MTSPRGSKTGYSDKHRPTEKFCLSSGSVAQESTQFVGLRNSLSMESSGSSSSTPWEMFWPTAPETETVESPGKRHS